MARARYILVPAPFNTHSRAEQNYWPHFATCSAAVVCGHGCDASVRALLEPQWHRFLECRVTCPGHGPHQSRAYQILGHIHSTDVWMIEHMAADLIHGQCLCVSRHA